MNIKVAEGGARISDSQFLRASQTTFDPRSSRTRLLVSLRSTSVLGSQAQLRFFIVAHLADSLARLASSPSEKVSDFPLVKFPTEPKAQNESADAQIARLGRV